MSSDKTPVQRMLIEAMTAASELVDEVMRKDFLVVGGAALVRYGSTRKTDDVDIAITAETLHAFSTKASTDSRFKKYPDHSWTYTCQGQGIQNLVVEVEFLDIGGGFIPKIHGLTKFKTVYVASLADIVLMKALAYQDREEETDFVDMKFALGMMVKRGETFKRYKFRKSEIEVIDQAVRKEGDDGVEELFEQLTVDVN